jgi:hypothetical protein
VTSKKHQQCTNKNNVVGIAAFFNKNTGSNTTTASSAGVSHADVPGVKDSEDINKQLLQEDSEGRGKVVLVPSAPNIAKYLQTKETRKAEILWALKCVMNHFSFSSNEDMSELFRTMFYDSNIAKNYSCSRTKMAYLITFGIAPAFKDNLVKTVRERDVYTIMFDEAFNTVLQLDQMDFVVRFWHMDMVESRYLGSQFINHTRAEDLVEAFKKGVAELDMTKLVQVGMDGPNVNLKTGQLLTEDRKGIDPEIPELLEVGVCNLHVLHGALKTGFKTTGWELEKLLRSLYWLFHDSFGRRRQYTEITKSTVFPMNFCATRWTEDEPVAQRAIEMLPNIKKYVEESLKKKKSEIPTCASFMTVKEAVLNDKLLVAKLEFFVFVARLLKEFLTKYQKEEPLIVYLAKDIALLLNDVLGLFIKPTVLEENNSGYKLATLDVKKPENHLPAKKLNLGNGTREALESARVSPLQVLEFKNQCLGVLRALVAKIQERCPLKYSFVRSLHALDPKAIIANPDSVQRSFSTIAKKMSSANIRSVAQCDRAEIEYRRMLREEADDIQQFEFKQHRLDQFYYNLLNGKEQYKELWSIVKTILVISHGQAKVERGFSVNEDMLQQNIKQETVVSLRLIYDTMKSLDIKIHNFVISDELLQSCNRARVKYELYLMDQQKAKLHEEKKRKAGEIEDIYIKEKKRLKSLEEQADSCVTESDKKAKEALKKQDFKLLAHSVALKEKADKMRKKEIADQKKLVEELKSKLA